MMTVVYGFNTIEQRKALWDGLNGIAQGINSPWLVCGDFNALQYSDDRLMGTPVSYAEIQGLSERVHDLLLNELNWRGEYYTQTNQQHGDDRICSRLDRAFGNYGLMMQWGQVTTEYDAHGISDHAPMILNLYSNQWSKPFYIF